MSSTMTKQDGSDQYPKIKMYTNHGCGWCHRVHIALKELGLAYEEVFVDLDNPRPDWFLKLNPVCIPNASPVSSLGTLAYLYLLLSSMIMPCHAMLLARQH
jgi:glutathione S-transferase